MREPTVIYEDNHLLGLNKPSGLLSQGDHTGDPTIADWGRNYLKIKYEKPGEAFLHPVHRLDRPVSGVVLCARTSKALSRMNEAFQQRQMRKTYLAIVLGKPKENSGELVHFLLKDEKHNFVTAYKNKPEDKPKAQESILKYEFLEEREGLSLLKINPLTGRPHQIRVQLSSMGCPILGDLRYGATTPLPDASIGLHAWQLAFFHPVQLEEVLILAEQPRRDFWGLFSRI